MEYKSNDSYFLGPFTGFGYFVSHPRLWWLPMVAVFFLTAILIAIFTMVSIWFWPIGAMPFFHKFWLILKAFGLATAGVLVGFIILMPLIITLALDKMVRKVLVIENANATDVSFFKSIYSSTVIFFKTFFWRIFWPVVGLIAALFLGPFGVFISQLGIGHLAAIDGVDLTLALKGFDTKSRIAAYKKERYKIFAFGFFAAILSLILSVTIIGWLLWIPAVFCGAALWVKDWPELNKS